jgi:hypothetical protein
MLSKMKAEQGMMKILDILQKHSPAEAILMLTFILSFIIDRECKPGTTLEDKMETVDNLANAIKEILKMKVSE